MNLIVCLDNNNGMSFNGRRQSRDKVLIERIEKNISGHKLFTHPKSAPLFSTEVNSCENFLSAAGDDDYCFTESELPKIEDINKLIIYRWNRSYPFDVEFNTDLDKFKLIKTDEFAGSSHEKITEEVYEYEK